MPEDKNDVSDFKVVDRRSFAEDGSRRAPAPEAGKTTEVRQPPPRSSSPPAESRGVVESAQTEEDYPDEGPANFATLVSYLSTTAMFRPSSVATMVWRSAMKADAVRFAEQSFVPSMTTANWASAKAAASVVIWMLAL